MVARAVGGGGGRSEHIHSGNEPEGIPLHFSATFPRNVSAENGLLIARRTWFCGISPC